MLETKQESRRRMRRNPSILFAPLAWLKLQFFCHVGDTEISGFAITAKEDPLYVEDFITVRQHTSPVTVELDDQAVADFMDRCVDDGLHLQNVLRIWIHTHPGSSVEPSRRDEATFARVFGACDWAVMFILGRTANTFARLSFQVGPGAAVQIPTAVDWSAWAELVADPTFSITKCFDQWQREFTTNIVPIDQPLVLPMLPLDASNQETRPLQPTAEAWEWNDLDQELWEDFERHERALNEAHPP